MRSAVINGYLITIDGDNKIFNKGCLIYENGIISYVGDQTQNLNGIDEVIDAKGNIVMPGLINTHAHSPMSLLRGYDDDLPLKDWLEQKMWPVEFKFKEEHIKWGTKLAVVEMLLTGTTTYSDMYIQMDTVAEVVELTGIRANLSRGIIGFGTDIEKKNKLKEAVSFAERWNKQANGRITTMLSPHSAYTCQPDYLREIIMKAKELQLPIQTHVSETAFEVEESIKNYGLRPITHFKELGLFDLQVLLAHAVHVNDEEMEILKQYNVKVSHNPGSNLKLGSGIAPVTEMLKRGITVSLGTDSAASNNNLDLFEKMRLAALIQKGYYQDPTILPAKEAIKMATINGAESLFLTADIGSLEIGKKADFVIINKEQAHFHPMYDPISHLVYSASGKDVLHSVINGKQIVKNGEILTIDVERVLFEVERLADDWRK